MSEPTQLSADDLANKLPIPKGYKILVAVPKSEDTYGSSMIVKADSTLRNEEIMTLVGYVLATDDETYKDKVKFHRRKIQFSTKKVTQLHFDAPEHLSALQSLTHNTTSHYNYCTPKQSLLPPHNTFLSKVN